MNEGPSTTKGLSRLASSLYRWISPSVSYLQYEVSDDQHLSVNREQCEVDSLELTISLESTLYEFPEFRSERLLVKQVVHSQARSTGL